VSSLVIDNIGELVTNEPPLGEGPLGVIRGAALVIEGDRVTAVEAAGAVADERLDAGGRAVSSSPATGPRSSRRGWPGAATRRAVSG
jgi:hypothetical protein